MRKSLMMALAVLALAGCGADREKMSRHNHTENILSSQQQQIEKAKQVEQLLKDTEEKRYQDQ